MQDSMMQMQDSMALLYCQLVDVLQHQANAPRGNYQAPTRFSKLDLPKFMKENVVGWLSKCENYFDVDKTPTEYKVTMASLMLDETGYQWYDSLKRASQEPITWQIFAEGIRVRFGATLRRPLEELMHLKQTGNLNYYQDKFERISCRSNLTKDKKLDCYLSGLREEIAWDVRLMSPRNVLEANKFAILEGLSIKSNTKGGNGG